MSAAPRSRSYALDRLGRGGLVDYPALTKSLTAVPSGGAREFSNYLPDSEIVESTEVESYQSP